MSMLLSKRILTMVKKKTLLPRNQITISSFNSVRRTVPVGCCLSLKTVETEREKKKESSFTLFS